MTLAEKTASMMATATPVMKQFLSAKLAYPDALVFFRMGDFYELFYDDAVVAARALELTLTARNKGAAEEIPMAGVPHHAASAYIQRLLDQGFMVAICEQMADPATVKGIVPREVVRVVTPGVVFDTGMVSERENHYLAAAIEQGGVIGIAALDLTTGELVVTSTTERESALTEMVRWDPREVLVGSSETPLAMELSRAARKAVLREVGALDELTGLEITRSILGERESLLARAPVAAKTAAAQLLAWARKCEPGRRIPIERIAVYELSDALMLDESTQSHLELVRTLAGESVGSLLRELDQTKTGAGARLLRKRLLAPRKHLSEIRRSHDRVEFFLTQPALRDQVRTILSGVSDLERLGIRLTTGRAAPKDLALLRDSLGKARELEALLATTKDPLARDAFGVSDGRGWLIDTSALEARLKLAVSDSPPAKIADGGVIREGFDGALDESRQLLSDGQRVITDLESRLAEETQIASLKIKFTRVFGWYIELTKTHMAKAPKEWRRKQTVASGERYVTPELEELAEKLLHAEDRASEREAELFSALIREMGDACPQLLELSRELSEIDVAASLADVAHREDWARPEMDDSLVLAIEEGRHPVVEKLSARGVFVPNDVTLDGARSMKERVGASLWLITGPNMAGKSTLMRQTALIVILAQMGSFVPAKRARIGIVDRVLTRVGASDNLSKGESTFMVEMKETAAVLRKATQSSLVILDEIGRGTSTYDGLAIAWAVAEHLHDVLGCRAMFATHYHELTELATSRPRCANYSVSAKEHNGDIVFFHRVQEGAASRSYGVACAKLAGLPEAVLSRARVLLDEFERGDSGASSRRKPRVHSDQVALFAEVPKENPALLQLKEVDIDRLTPLEALQLLSQLKQLAEKPHGG